jgi:hypothetical protein
VAIQRSRPWRRLAALRAARRRGSEVTPREAGAWQRDPLPPLVSPDDDREFAGPRPPQALELKPA